MSLPDNDIIIPDEPLVVPVPRYFAQVDESNIVIRVVVCKDSAWLATNLGGVWVETADPYLETPQEVVYCGPGFGHDDRFPERFAPQWQQPQGYYDEEGLPQPPEGYAEGALVFHNGRIWRSTTPGNVWEPGVSGWHDSPDSGIADWVQPTGAHDSYPLGAEVMHNGIHWVSTVADNVWEPGVYGWDLLE